MLGEYNRGSLVKFFLWSIWLSVLILLPYFIITNDLFVDEEWWRSNPYRGLWFSIPCLLILLRKIFRAMHSRS